MKKGGKVIIFENICVPWFLAFRCGRILHAVTSSRALSPLTKKLGANTAGTGILYFDKNELEKIAIRNGFKVKKCEKMWQYSRKFWRAVNLDYIDTTMFVLSVRA